MNCILSFDLGTGGLKACLYDEKGARIAFAFEEYATYYPKPGWQEQDPEDWWAAIAHTLGALRAAHPREVARVKAVSISGYSLGAVPVDARGQLLTNRAMVWSDGRAAAQADVFFAKVNRDDWYLQTGAGFPAHFYTAFKIRWYKDNAPELYKNARAFLGTKDYINYRLTGVMATDFSYASGCGAYALKTRAYNPDWLAALEIDLAKLPAICASDAVLGPITQSASNALGLPEGVQVFAGGVDNACMALGAGCFRNGDSYTSLGTSAWVAVSNETPIVDIQTRPYVFEHCVPGQYVSATCIMSAGRSFRWIRDVLFQDRRESGEGGSLYDFMCECAAQSPVGARGLLFNPSLSGGSSLDASECIRGGLIGLSLMHTREDVIRAGMEGIALNLRLALNALGAHARIDDEMLLVGGGARSALWRQIFADAYNKTIRVTRVDQDAAALGACALAAVKLGMWDGYAAIDRAHEVVSRVSPVKANAAAYEKLLVVFEEVALHLSQIGERMKALAETSI